MRSLQLQKRFMTAVSIWLLATTQSQIANAHFLYATSVKHDGKQEARLYFSEGSHVEAERMPERIAAAKFWCVAADRKVTELAAQKVDRENQPQLAATLSTNGPCSIEASCKYGVYQTFLLTYYAKHMQYSNVTELNAQPVSKKLALDVVPKRTEHGLQLTVLWKNKPLPNAELLLTSADEDETEVQTNRDGVVEWKCEKPGLYSVRAHHVEKEHSGKLNGKEYSSGHHYSTLTLNVGTSETPAKKTTTKLPTLPEAVSSFGAVVSDGWLYVYSGHTGKAHDHSKDNLSTHFRRISLSGGDWEELPCQTPLQGLAIVAHQGNVYRIGGMTARNSIEDDADLHSSSDFSRFDTKTKKWQAMPSLPAGRSSHDAVVIDGRIYVVGGWCLSGSDEGDWQSETLVFDLSEPSAKWVSIDQPFERRALAASHVGGDLVVIGGMNADHEIERTVNVYSPATQTWSALSNLPGEGMNGFGASAWNADGELHVSGSDGIVYRLSPDRSAWEETAKLTTPRFFHQFVPSPSGDILAVGGASMRVGHLQSIERVRTKER